MNEKEIISFNVQDLLTQDSGFAYYILGRSYDLEENGLTQDYDKALHYYNKGAEIDYPLCLYSLGISYELGLGDVLAKDEAIAKKLLTEAYLKIIEIVNSPSTDEIERIYATFVLGAYYYFGLGNIEKDDAKAFQIIKYCADNGHIAAIYDLGANFYYNGCGTEINNELADYYLNLAKSHGLKRAVALYNERNSNKLI